MPTSDWTYRRVATTESGEAFAREVVEDARRLDRQSVLEWLQAAENHQDALLVLQGLDRSHWPEIFDQHHSLNENFVANPESLALPSRPPITADRSTSLIPDGHSYIQFAKDSRHARESDKKVCLIILKQGDLSQKSEVKYFSEELDKNVSTHEEVSGTVIFMPNQALAEIEVEINDRDTWSRNRSFVVKLSEPKNALLMEHMAAVYVHIYDKDSFPSNAYATISNLEDDTDGYVLMAEYIKMAWGDRKVYKATIWRCTCVQFRNIRILATLLSQQFLVDRVLAIQSHHIQGGVLPVISDAGGKEMALIALTVISVVLVLTEWLFEVLKFAVSVGGPLRRDLQTALLERVLYYTGDSLATLVHGKFVMAMARDSLSLVSDCHNKVILVSEVVGEIACLYVYFMVSPMLFGRPFHPNLFLATLMYPVFLSLILVHRSRATYEARLHLNEAQDKFVNEVVSILQRIRLILGYRQRASALTWIKVMIAKYNNARRSSNRKLVDNEYYGQIVTVCVSAAVSIFFGMHVLGDRMSIGVYLVSVSATKSLGHAWTKMYVVLNEVHGVTPQLHNIADFLNRKTDLEDLESLDTRGNEHVRAFYDNNTKAVWDLDSKPLKIVFDGMSCDIPQGHLVGIIGQDKAELLRHISGSSPLPRGIRGHVFMPPHLHVVFVDSETEFFLGTLKENLVFGVHRCNGKDREDVGRVISICKMLGVSQSVIAAIESDEEASWLLGLSQTQLCLLHLARALIADPEVLCIKKPTELLPQTKAKKTFEVLNLYVKHRGLGRDNSTDAIQRRRARTCIFTCSKEAEEQKAAAQIVLRSGGDGSLQREFSGNGTHKAGSGP